MVQVFPRKTLQLSSMFTHQKPGSVRLCPAHGASGARPGPAAGAAAAPGLSDDFDSRPSSLRPANGRSAVLHHVSTSRQEVGPRCCESGYIHPQRCEAKTAGVGCPVHPACILGACWCIQVPCCRDTLLQTHWKNHGRWHGPKRPF